MFNMLCHSICNTPVKLISIPVCKPIYDVSARMCMTVLVFAVDMFYSNQKVCEHQQFPRVSCAKSSSSIGLRKKVYTEAVV